MVRLKSHFSHLTPHHSLPTTHSSPITNHQSPITIFHYGSIEISYLTPHSTPLTPHQSPITNHNFPLWFDWNFSERIKRNKKYGTSQFHYGSIEMSKRLIWMITTKLCLNSIMVRLKYPGRGAMVTSFHEVSIPLWFDWNPECWFIVPVHFEVSQFHYGSIEMNSASMLPETSWKCLNSIMVRLKCTFRLNSKMGYH